MTHWPHDEALSKSKLPIDEVIAAGANRLLARASNGRSLDVDSLVPRVRATVEKYLLKHDADAALDAISSFIDTLHGDDLCLAIACQHGNQAAWSDLVEGYGATVRSAARSASPNEEMAEDLAQSIWAELHGLKVQEDGRPAGKLAYYSGAGSLGGWLRAVVGQLAIDRHRREARLVHTEEDGDLDRLSRDAASEANAGFQPQPSPEDALTANLAAAAVENALSRALRELDDEDRLLVKLYYFDGLRLREAGAVLGFHEATASRRLTRIHSEVRKRVEALLMHEHGWTKSEATRSLSQIAAVLQTDVESLLKAPQPSLVPQAAAEGESAAI
ncbi:MAG TPA: sigma-70 family RNA polymerase sigma factor [Pyrinomonadaceae bacterium]|jgi:RNA polymerase sigma-70 factor